MKEPSLITKNNNFLSPKRRKYILKIHPHVIVIIITITVKIIINITVQTVKIIKKHRRIKKKVKYFVKKTIKNNH